MSGPSSKTVRAEGYTHYASIDRICDRAGGHAKIARHTEAPGGIARLTFQMNAASLPHAKMMRAIETIGTRVAPALRGIR